MTEPPPTEELECVEVMITAESAEWLADFLPTSDGNARYLRWHYNETARSGQ